MLSPSVVGGSIVIVVWTVYLVGDAVVPVDSEGVDAVVGLVVLGVDVLVVMLGAVVEAVVVVMGVGLVVVK